MLVSVLDGFIYIVWLCVLSHVQLFGTSWTVAPQAPLFMGFSRLEYWSGLPCPPPGDLPDPGIEPRSPALQADSLLSEPSWGLFMFLERTRTLNFNIQYSVSAEKAMAPHSSIVAWKIPWVEEPGRLQSMGLWKVGHDWATSLSLFTFMHWRRKWQPTPVFLPGESQGRGSLVGCRLWGRTESDTTEAT